MGLLAVVTRRAFRAVKVTGSPVSFPGHRPGCPYRTHRLAQCTEQLVVAGIFSDWAMNKKTSHQPRYTRGPGIAGMELP